MILNSYNLDAAGTIFLGNQLEHLKSRITEVLYQPLMADTLIPVDTTTPEGAEIVIYRQYDATGERAKIISNYADDIPLVDVNGKQMTSGLRTIADAYLISIQDIKAANYAKVALEQRKLQAAIKVQRQEMNYLAFHGDAAHGIPGWLTNPDVDNQLVAGANADARKWANKIETPNLILQDLFEGVTSIRVNTKGTESPNRLAVPISQYQIMATTYLSPMSNTTILEQFGRTYPGIGVFEASELAGGFAGKTDGFILYDYDSLKLHQEIPYLFQISEPQVQNLAFKVIIHSRYGGTIVEYPKSMVFRRGI